MGNLGDRLKNFRQTKDLTIRQAAKKLGVPETTYRDWEAGRAVRPQHLQSLSQVFDVSLVVLLGLDQSETVLDALERIFRDVQALAERVRKERSTEK